MGGGKENSGQKEEDCLSNLLTAGDNSPVVQSMSSAQYLVFFIAYSLSSKRTLVPTSTLSLLSCHMLSRVGIVYSWAWKSFANTY